MSTEAYEKLRNEFRGLSLTDQVSLLAEATLKFSPSSLLGGLNLGGGDLFNTIGASIGSLANVVGISSGSDSVVSKTVDRVVITVKDAGKAANAIFS